MPQMPVADVQVSALRTLIVLDARRDQRVQRRVAEVVALWHDHARRPAPTTSSAEVRA